MMPCFVFFYSFVMLIVDAIDDHMVETYSSIGIVTALYIESYVSFVERKSLSRALSCCQLFIVGELN